MTGEQRLYLKSEVDKAIRATTHPPKGNPKEAQQHAEPIRFCGKIGVRGRAVPRHMTLDELEGGATR